MPVLIQYFRVVKWILFSDYSYSRWILLWCYTTIICRSVLFHKLGIGSKQVREAQVMGFSVKFFDFIQLLTLFEEIFVFEVYRFSIQNSQPVVVDCGSNIGLSILYIKTVCPAAKIIAFEPDHETFELLNENILNNNLNDVTCHNLALSNFVGEATLFKSGISGSPGMSLIASDHSHQNPVSVALLSHFVNEHVDFLKIDVEGSEIQILNDLIESDKIGLMCQIVIEFHPSKLGGDIQQYLCILERNNFTFQARHTVTDKASDKIYYFTRMNEDSY